MKHESIVVVYDSCEAIAEEIASKLGAETVSVQSVNTRQVENSQSLVLAIEFQGDGLLTPHWQYAYETLCKARLNGKSLAVLIALGNEHDNKVTAKKLCYLLRENGAHIVGTQPYVGTPGWSRDNWVCAISPNV